RVGRPVLQRTSKGSCSIQGSWPVAGFSEPLLMARRRQPAMRAPGRRGRAAREGGAAGQCPGRAPPVPLQRYIPKGMGCMLLQLALLVDRPRRVGFGVLLRLDSHQLV